MCISKQLKITTRAMTTDPYQFAAFVEGVGLVYLGNQNQDRSEVRKLAAAKLDNMGDDPRVLAVLLAKLNPTRAR
jgi:hypothetical protein